MDISKTAWINAFQSVFKHNPETRLFRNSHVMNY